jgi:hypothetical protein
MTAVKKYLLPALFLVLILISVPVGVYLVQQRQEIRKQAAPATTLTLDPIFSEVFPGDEFGVKLMISTGENQVPAVDVIIGYDSSAFEFLNVDKGFLFANDPVPGDDSIPGQVQIIYYNEDPVNTASGLVATFNFRVLENATVGVKNFTFVNARAGGIDETTNVVNNTIPATVTVASLLPTPTITPTLMPTATVTPAPTGEPEPTPTEQPGPTNTPMPTNTPVPGATSTPGPTNTPVPAATSTLTATPTVPTTASLAPTQILVISAAALLLMGILALLVI